MGGQRMTIHSEDYEHPTQASRYRLNVFDQPAESAVAGLPSGGFLVTEERIGTHTVVATLGGFPDKEAALQCLRQRAAELQRQGWVRLEPAA